MPSIKFIITSIVIAMLFNAIGKSQRALAYQSYNNGCVDTMLEYSDNDDHPRL